MIKQIVDSQFKLILFSLLIPVLASCQSSSGNEVRDKIHQLKSKISSIIQRSASLNYSKDGLIEMQVPDESSDCNFVTIKKYIPLETTKEFLLGSVKTMEMVADKIYVLDDRTNAVCIFNTEGKFLKRIHDVGNGPKEYIKLASMYVSEQNNYLILFDSQRKKFLYYDLEGNFIGVKECYLWNKGFTMFNSGEFAYYIDKEYDNIAELIITDKNLVPRKRGINGAEPNTSLRYYSSTMQFKDYEGAKLLMPAFRDTVYEFSIDSAKAKYVLKYPGSKLPQDYAEKGIDAFFSLVSKGDYLYSLGEFFENKDFAGFGIENGKLSENLIYCKKTGHIFRGKLRDKRSGLITNYPAKTSSSNVLMIDYAAEKIIKHCENSKGLDLPSDLLDLSKKIKKYDNPVICILEFKTF